MSVELITERKKLPALANRWNELAAEDTRDGFFRTYCWYTAWMQHIRPDAQPFVVVVRDASGEILGLAPLCLLKYRDLGFQFSAISWAGREVVSGDFLDVIAAFDARSHVASAVLEYLWSQHRKWSALVLGELLEGGGFYDSLKTLADREGLAVRRQEERICPYIPLPASFDSYLTGLSSSTRYHIRRRTRDIEKKGGMVEVFSRPDEICANLDTLTRLHLARWKRDGRPGTLARPGFQVFLKEVCTNLPATSSCRLYLLCYNGSATAALLTFYFGKSALYYQAGWDPESRLAELSPGVVLMARSILDAIEHGLESYEFLRGDEDYKSRWAKNHRKTITLLVARSSLAKGYLRVCRMKDIVKRSLLAKRSVNEIVAGAPLEGSKGHEKRAASLQG